VERVRLVSFLSILYNLCPLYLDFVYFLLPSLSLCLSHTTVSSVFVLSTSVTIVTIIVTKLILLRYDSPVFLALRV